MVNILLLLLSSLLLVSCSGNKGTEVNLKVTQGFAISGSTGGTILSLTNTTTKNEKTILLENEEVTITLENGVWDFALFSWDGIRPLSGSLTCAKDIVTLNGEKKVVDLFLNSSNCADPAFKLDDLKLVNCQGVGGLIAGDLCDGAKRGKAGAYRVRLKSEGTNDLRSSCFKAADIPYSLSATNLTLPWGFSPLFEIDIFSDGACSKDKKTVGLKDALNFDGVVYLAYGGGDNPPTFSFNGLALAQMYVGLNGTLSPTYAYDIDTCTVTPTLPTGLMIDDTCTISGVPTGILNETTFYVTASNAYGSTTEPLQLKVGSPFITKWKTDNLLTGSSDANQISLPLVDGEDYEFIVDWGDGNSDVITSWDSPLKTHTYSGPGSYTVQIFGKFPRIKFFDSPESYKILEIIQWGTNAWTSMEGAFANCINLTSNATDAPNLAQATSLSRMFFYANSFNGDISHWVTDTITDMSFMFKGAYAFNQPIGAWNTSNVTTMEEMFRAAFAFNQDISGWDTSKITNMRGMFSEALVFNQNISSWNTSNVIDMSSMFQSTDEFNQNIGGWNTSKVTTMSGMFYEAAVFNQDIGGWDTSKVTDLAYMFMHAMIFNQDLSAWNTSNVTTMGSMFWGATTFNQDVGAWDTSKVKDMSAMFYNATAFNQNLSSWDTSSVLYSTNFSFNNPAWMLPKPNFNP